MADDREQSVAFQAASKRARRAFEVIKAEIARTGTGKALITSSEMMGLLGISSTSSIAASARELVALGLIVTDTEGPRRATVYALAEGWREITDPAAAERAAHVARATITKRPATKVTARVESNKRRKPVEARPEPEHEQEPEQRGPRAISLAVLPCRRTLTRASDPAKGRETFRPLTP